MNFRTCIWPGAVSLCLAAAMPLGLAAQDNGTDSNKKHQHYKLIDLGTLGGPTSGLDGANVLNNRGTVAGDADTNMHDAFAPNCWSISCSVEYAFKWHDGKQTVLGSLASNANSIPFWENDRGWLVGASETGVIDGTLGTPQYAAVLWKHGEMVNLGTLGGASGLASSVNNRGEVAGGASNGSPDRYSMLSSDTVGIGPFPANTQTRAFVWLDGLLFNLGTLGGPDSIALFNNDKGQVAGISYPNDIPISKLGLPAVATFLWQQGEMRNIGNLGGHYTFPSWMNEHGEIVGQSNLRDDQIQHAFIWTHGSLKDLGTLGGDFAIVLHINDDGVACGFSAIPSGTPVFGHPFLWKNGHMRDLGPPPAGFFCAAATWVNEREQAVGDSDCDAQGRESAFIAEYGLPPADLNPLVVPGGDLRVRDAVAINDRGEIACRGLLRNGDVHACMLIPIDREHEWDDDATTGLQRSTADAAQANSTTGAAILNGKTKEAQIQSMLNRSSRRRSISGRYAVPSD